VRRAGAGSGRNWWLIAPGSLGAILLVVLVLAQIFLPGIAAQKVRERVGRYGTVQSASVKAFPAIELLWEKADSATVRAGRLRMSATQAIDLLWSSRRVKNMDLGVETLTTSLSGLGPLTLHHVSFQKRGDQLHVLAELSEADLRAAVPAGLEVKPLGSGGGQVELQASGGLFGIGATVPVILGPQEGKLVAQPRGLPFAGLARLTLFADPRVVVQGVALSAIPGGDETPAGTPSGGYQVRLLARLGR
jgi:hypothetical protein